MIPDELTLLTSIDHKLGQIISNLNVKSPTSDELTDVETEDSNIDSTSKLLLEKQE